MSNKLTTPEKPKPTSMKQLEEFARRVLSVPKSEVDAASKTKHHKRKR